MILMIIEKTLAVRLVPFAMMLAVTFTAAAAKPVETELFAAQWELSVSAERLLTIDAVADIVNAWSTDSRQQIELQYPGGEEGELWVYQLMDGLVALGIPSGNLLAVPGSGQGDVIRLRVIRTGGNYR